MKAHGSEVRCIFLVGFMGAGKTSVGRALGARLAWPFEDLDDRIRSREGRSIEEIFRDSGEQEFRRAEHQALHEIVAIREVIPRIVGLGGGAFVQPANALMIQQLKAITVFLDASVDELWRRCQNDRIQRPLQKDEQQFRSLYNQRRPKYMMATYRVETTGKTIDQVAEEVTVELGLNGKKE